LAIWRATAKKLELLGFGYVTALLIFFICCVTFLSETVVFRVLVIVHVLILVGNETMVQTIIPTGTGVCYLLNLLFLWKQE
jgi:hypothetical protein